MSTAAPIAGRRRCLPRRRAPGPSSALVGVATLGSIGAVLHQARDGEAAALRQQIGAAGAVLDHAARRVRRGYRPAACRTMADAARTALRETLSRSRAMREPRRRSTSTGWCAIPTCAANRMMGDLPAQPRAERQAQACQPRRSRSRCASACATVSVPPRHRAVKVVEPPPGPPVMATLLAEVYGPDAETAPPGGDQGARGLRLAVSPSSSTSTTAIGTSAERRAG